MKYSTKRKGLSECEEFKDHTFCSPGTFKKIKEAYKSKYFLLLYAYPRLVTSAKGNLSCLT